MKLLELQAPKAPQLTLLLLHHAGGSAAGYRHFTTHLPDHWRILAPELPGRIHTPKQPGCRTAHEAVNRLLPALKTEPPTPYAVFGHSMGALIAFELVRTMEQQGQTPLWLGLSGSPAPKTGHPPTEQRHTWPHKQLAHFIRQLGGTPDNIWRHPALAERMVRTMRQDLEITETYEHPGGIPLTTPISLFTGKTDPLVTPEQIHHWHKHTRNTTTLHTLPGGHFYLFEQTPEICRQIVKDITATHPGAR